MCKELETAVRELVEAIEIVTAKECLNYQIIEDSLARVKANLPEVTNV